ncbi:MAG: AbrB/MazE/SpoVT family DNA-binding domain-containing protein [bacterium]
MTYFLIYGIIVSKKGGKWDMTTTIVTTKGQIVIPSKIRRHLNLKKGTKLYVEEKDSEIILKPMTAEYFDKIAGVLKGKKDLAKELLKERAKDMERENKKW